MPLDLTALRKALISLENALQQPKNEYIRDSVIQRFEYSYELSWQALRRFMQENLGRDKVINLNRKDQYRLAAETNLIDDPKLWFEFHDARNSTSHAYGETIAEKVYAAAVRFAPVARRLILELERRGCD